MLAGIVAGVLAAAPASAQLFGNRQGAQAQLQIDQLNQQVRTLTGQVEQLSYQVRALQEQLRRFQEDAEFRFQQLEGSGRRGELSPDLGTPQPGSSIASTDDSTLYPSRTSPPAANGTLDFTLQDAPEGAPPPGVRVGEEPALGTQPAPAPGPGGPIDLDSLANGVVDPMTGQPYYIPQSHEVPEGQDPAAPQDASLTIDPTATGSTGDDAAETAGETELQDPKALYSDAYGAVMRGDYSGAEVRFARFIGAYPEHELAENARYWLGQSYFSRGQYDKAAEAFLTVYEGNPASPKAPASLLKLAQALNELGETAVACATLRDVISKYPDEPIATSGAEQELNRVQC